MSSRERTPFGLGANRAPYRRCCTLYARDPKPCFVASGLKQLVRWFPLHHVILEHDDGCQALPALAADQWQAVLTQVLESEAGELQRAVGFLGEDDCFVLSPEKLSIAAGSKGSGAPLTWAMERVGPGRPIGHLYRGDLFETTFVLDEQELMVHRLERLVHGGGSARRRELGLEWWRHREQQSLFVRWRYYQMGPLHDEDDTLRQVWESTNNGNFEFLRMIAAYCSGPGRFARCDVRSAVVRAYKEALGYPE